MQRSEQYRETRSFGVALRDIVEKIENSANLEELKTSLQEAIEGYGFSGFSFVDAGRPHLDMPFYISTTGEDWENEYKSNNFVHVDPFISKARRSNTPFPWSSVGLPPRMGKRKPGALQLMEAATDHGFTDGYVFPFHFVDLQGRIYSTVNGLFWRDDASRMAFLLQSEKRLELNLILLYWSERAISLQAETNTRSSLFSDLPTANGNSSYLTDREREVLEWAGRGLTVPATADLLTISEETVQTHVRNAIQKLGATNKTHAVAKALHLGMLDL